MSPTDFRAAALILYGPEWRAPMREFLGCSDRNLSRFATGSKEVGDGFEADILQAIRDRYASNPTPVMMVFERALGTN